MMWVVLHAPVGRWESEQSLWEPRFGTLGGRPSVPIWAGVSDRRGPHVVTAPSRGTTRNDASHVDRGTPTFVGPLIIDGERALH